MTLRSLLFVGQGSQFYRTVRRRWCRFNKSHRELFPDDVDALSARPPLVVPSTDPDHSVGLRANWDFRG